MAGGSVILTLKAIPSLYYLIHFAMQNKLSNKAEQVLKDRRSNCYKMMIIFVAFNEGLK